MITSVVLLALGLALAVFGAVVLLKFPDRPGGKFAWRGMELSSAGAGLPLIALGIFSIVLAARTGSPTRGAVSTPETGPARAGSAGAAAGPAAGGGSVSPGDSACFAREFAALPADRVAVLEAGAQDVDVIGPRQSKGKPVAIRFTEGGEPVGAIEFRFFPGSSLFKITRVLDALCDPVEDYRNLSRGGDKNALMNYDELQLRAGGRTYQLRLGGSAAGIRVNFTRVEP